MPEVVDSPLLKMVLEQTLRLIEISPYFDARTVAALRGLASRGKLSDIALVQAALESIGQ